MKLSEWARGQGVTYRTAWNWFRAGTLPVPARQLDTGTILVEPPTTEDGRTVAYCRMSSADQCDDLDRQVGRVAQECARRGIALDSTITEIGSGLNGNRNKLAKLLADPTATTIVVEHRERLARFGVEHLEAALSAQSRRIVVLNDADVEDDLVRDVTEVLTSMCARLYGRRSAAKRAKAAMKAAEVAPR
ncbi:putative resolvase [Actinopolyspora mzabensis]|uniref:Putative resolvase n=1 Tax=Actinopolyspora mzabensis TaxID=995066 RepID=A0A1G9EMD2_ACTMZ|nr:IS607 family transposase [Actinopolyspora mzabensis]SDK77175.1 putative resolvase [Actinopolyspora mzabensis]